MNKPYGNSNGQIWSRIEKRERRRLGRMGNIKNKIMNTMFQKKVGRRWTWKSPNCVTKAEIHYILTNRPDIVTDIKVVNQINIGSNNRLVTSNIKLDVEEEMNKIDDQEATKSRCHINRVKEDRVPT